MACLGKQGLSGVRSCTVLLAEFAISASAMALGSLTTATTSYWYPASLDRRPG